MAHKEMSKSKIVRAFWIILGFISLGLGCVGIALPILPTVPFFLLTSFCFVRGSKRFNEWFLNSKLYHKYCENFAETRSMVLRNELILLLCVSAMLMITMYFVNSLVVTCILTSLIGLKYLYFVLRVKPINKKEWQIMQDQRAQAQEEKEKLLEENKINEEKKEGDIDAR